MAKQGISLVGNTYGEWTVLEHTEPNYCICECSCGTIRRVAKKTLLNGTSKSCGHSSNTLKNIEGKSFGEWTVTKYLGNGYWECLCSCGNIASVSGYDLRNGKSTNCGHVGYSKLSHKNSEQRNKLEGKQINEWTVLEYVGDKHYKCRCSCGREKIVSVARLMDGGSKSCGHNNGMKSFIDLTGETFGDLTVLDYIGNKQYRCKCSCGNEVNVFRYNLIYGGTRSCGCKRLDTLTKEYLIEVINDIYLETGQLPFINEIAKRLSRNEGDIARKIREYDLREQINKTFDSSIEKELFNLFPGAILHDRTELNGLELDLLYRDANVAIEINGDYWHSTLYKDIKYHQNKTIECAKRGIRLIHIFEYEWNDINKRKKIISLIDRVLNKSSKVIYARNTRIEYIDTTVAENFLNEHHLQNYAQSTIKLGCFDGENLIGVATFGKPRFNSNYDWELIRLCWADNISVIGGAEKLFKHFLNSTDAQNVITYTDISKFTGNVYTRLGFKTDESCITSPNYVWSNPSTGVVLTRSQTQKHKLLEDGLGSIEETENDIMGRLGYYKIYDSGNLRLVWNKNN